MIRRTAFLALAALLSAPVAPARDWPDSFVARLEILGLIETLNADLLASPSATTTLESWCAAHRMASPARLTAIAERTANVPIPAANRLALEIGPGEPVRYRRVALACGTHVLSRAENWYVPARLTPAMNRTLETTDVPFGRVIRPLRPERRTLSAERLWSPLPAGWETDPPKPAPPGGTLAVPPALFRHRAIVYDGRHRPLALVVETYTGEIVNF